MSMSFVTFVMMGSYETFQSVVVVVVVLVAKFSDHAPTCRAIQWHRSAASVFIWEGQAVRRLFYFPMAYGHHGPWPYIQ